MKNQALKVIRLFESGRQERWLEKLKQCDWSAGAFLYDLLHEGAFFETVGEGSKVLLLTDGDALLSFCTYAKWDDIQPTELTPWMGFVYTFPEHRGHRYAGLLLMEVTRLAKEEGRHAVYLSTNHIGLYEKYGFEYFGQMPDMANRLSRIYVKRIP